MVATHELCVLGERHVLRGYVQHAVDLRLQLRDGGVVRHLYALQTIPAQEGSPSVGSSISRVGEWSNRLIRIMPDRCIDNVCCTLSPMHHTWSAI